MNSCSTEAFTAVGFWFGLVWLREEGKGYNWTFIQNPHVSQRESAFTAQFQFSEFLQKGHLGKENSPVEQCVSTFPDA